MKSHLRNILTTAIVAAISCAFSPATLADDGDSPPASKVLLIPGRIEQTANTQAPLPIELTKQTAQMDTSTPAPSRMIQGGVQQLTAETSQSSYPPTLTGFWGGELTITSNYSKWVASSDPVRAQGAKGKVIFHFFQDGADIKLKPATIFLASLWKPLKDCMLQPKELAEMKQRAAEKGQRLDPNQIVERNQEILLGNFGGVKLDGGTRKVTVTSNTVRTTTPGVIEQDIVSKWEGVAGNGAEHSGYFEIICHFEQTGPDTESVKVAKINYRDDRTMTERIVFEGRLSRDWQVYADQISKQLNRPWEGIARRHDI